LSDAEKASAAKAAAAPAVPVAAVVKIDNSEMEKLQKQMADKRKAQREAIKKAVEEANKKKAEEEAKAKKAQEAAEKAKKEAEEHAAKVKKLEKLLCTNKVDPITMAPFVNDVVPDVCKTALAARRQLATGGDDLQAIIAEFKKAKADKEAAEKKKKEAEEAHKKQKEALSAAKKKVHAAYTAKPKPKAGEVSIDEQMKALFKEYIKYKNAALKVTGIVKVDDDNAYRRDYAWTRYKIFKDAEDTEKKAEETSDPAFAAGLELAKEKAAKAAKKADQLDEESRTWILSQYEKAKS